MQNKLFEVMKTYNSTLKTFIKTLTSENIVIKQNIMNSLFKQGILTLLWLYINKGIIHNDIILDNLFILKTTSKNFKINIYNDEYDVKLYGYYLIISDFGYAESIDIIEYKVPKNINISLECRKESDKIIVDSHILSEININKIVKESADNLYYKFNPLNDIKRFINIFNNIINIDYTTSIFTGNNTSLERYYNIMIEQYIKNKNLCDKDIDNLLINSFKKSSIKKYKETFYKYIKNNIIIKFKE
jgi:hypothetical protein